MFFRAKKSGPRSYLQIVENRWEGGSRQRVIATLGRLDHLRESGALDALMQSGARFAESSMVLTAHERGEMTQATTRRIGPAMIFERLWNETGCREVIGGLLKERRFEFPVERAIFLTVVHRLCAPGSDRAADRWRDDQALAGVEGLELHHLYRAMAWLGESLPEGKQAGKTPFAPRCTKDLVEEHLFQHGRNLFSGLDLVFFDTTSIYFEGSGGDDLGAYGHSKDHRPDRLQMVVGVVLTADGRPLCCELWPGNTADVKTLVPVVDRLRTRFGIQNVCIVADRGMISQETMREVEERKWRYILGARMRRTTEVRDEVLSRAGRYREVFPKSRNSTAPAPLKVKEVLVDDRRYVVCLNEDEATKDRHDREAIVAALRQALTRGDKALVGNKGYRRFLKGRGERFTIDTAKVEEDARYDGKWVLTTNTDLSAEETAVRYKQLWMVEDIFRTMKSVLETRPIYHRRDETIRGHVFCSFLALKLRMALQERLVAKGHQHIEWSDVIRDLDRLDEVEIIQGEKRFILRTETTGVCGKVFQAVGVALPPTLRHLPPIQE